MDCSQPQERIDLSNLKTDKFLLIIPNAPDTLTWKTNAVTLPSISSDVTPLSNNKITSYANGDTLTYSDLSVTFSVSNDLSNYLFMKHMLETLIQTNPEEFEYIDLILLDVNDKPKSIGLRLESMLNSLSGLEFNIQSDSGEHSATATFSVTQWYLINKGVKVDIEKYLAI